MIEVLRSDPREDYRGRKRDPALLAIGRETVNHYVAEEQARFLRLPHKQESKGSTPFSAICFIRPTVRIPHSLCGD